MPDSNFADETTPNNEKIRKEIFNLSVIKPDYLETQHNSVEDVMRDMSEHRDDRIRMQDM